MGRLLGDLRDYAEAHQLDYLRLLPGQLQFIQDQSRRKLMRAGNQAQGKTYAGILDVCCQARGDDRWRPAPPSPTEWWAVSSSEQQSGVLQEKLYNLIPRSWLSADTPWVDSKGGFRGKHPWVGIKHVGGGVSPVRFRWTGQKGVNLASASPSGGVWFDEPPQSRRAFTEVERRVTRTGGQVILTLTPVNAPVEYLRELCEKRLITDHHFPLRADLLIPVGESEPIRTGKGTVMDQAWIDEQRELVPSYEEPVVLDGEWETRAVGRVFERFDPTKHIITDLIHSDVFPRKGLMLKAGFDWGEEALRTSGVLIAVDEEDEEAPAIYVLAEYAPEVATVTEDDAPAVLQMLAGRNVRWTELDEAWGDKKYTDASGKISLKSCEDLHRQLAKRLRVPDQDLRPTIQNAKKGQGAGRGARNLGVRFLHAAMVRPGKFFIDAACKRHIAAIQGWKGGEMEEWKDSIDDMRYALRGNIIPQPHQVYIPGPIHMRYR